MRAWLLVPLLCAAALGIAALDDSSGLRTWWRLREDAWSSRQTLDRLKVDNERLKRAVLALETDPFALERAIREDLGWARPDEVVVVFEQPNSTSPASQSRRWDSRGIDSDVSSGPPGVGGEAHEAGDGGSSRGAADP